MTAKMNSSFMNYSDFLDILIDTYYTAPRELFEKMIQLVITSLHQQRAQLEKEALQIDEMNIIPVDDLEEYYDTTLDTIEDIKLLKNRIAKWQNKDIQFNSLYMTMDTLHYAFVSHMDRMGQLEITHQPKELCYKKVQNQFTQFVGIWKDRDITQESIREQAWK